MSEVKPQNTNSVKPKGDNKKNYHRRQHSPKPQQNNQQPKAQQNNQGNNQQVQQTNQQPKPQQNNQQPQQNNQHKQKHGNNRGNQNDFRKNRHDRGNHNRRPHVETVEDIRRDIQRIEKEIRLEISEISSIR